MHVRAVCDVALEARALQVFHTGGDKMRKAGASITVAAGAIVLVALPSWLHVAGHFRTTY